MPDNIRDDFVTVIAPDSRPLHDAEGQMLGTRYYLPTEGDKQRIAGYENADKLLDVSEHMSLFRVTDADTCESYIPLDLPGMLARLHRHYVVSPRSTVQAKTSGAQPEIDRIVENSDLFTQLRELSEVLPVHGDGVLRIDLVDPEEVGAPEEELDEDRQQARVRYVMPHRFYPELDPLDARRMIAAELAWVFPAEKAGVTAGPEAVASGGTPAAVTPRDRSHVVLRERFEVVSGSVQTEFLLNWWDAHKLGEKIPLASSTLVDESMREAQTLDIDEIPLVHFAHNRKAGEFWGRSEFPRIRPIVQALENRVAQLDEALEKHARPKLIVGPDTLDEEGRINLKDFDVIEVDASILEKAVKPEYLTWDMQIAGIQHEIEKLEEWFFMVTETSPASFGLERDGSQVESARALRFKAHRTVNKVEDARDPMSDGVRQALRIAQKLETSDDGDHNYEVSRLRLTWGDPIIEDQTQEVQDNVAMVNSNLTSIRRALMDLHDLDEEEAEGEFERILEEQDRIESGADGGLPPLVSGLSEEDLLGPIGGAPPPTASGAQPPPPVVSGEQPFPVGAQA